MAFRISWKLWILDRPAVCPEGSVCEARCTPIRRRRGRLGKVFSYVLEYRITTQHPLFIQSLRDCPKRSCWVTVVRYPTTHEKDIPHRPLRLRMGSYRTSSPCPQSPRQASASPSA